MISADSLKHTSVQNRNMKQHMADVNGHHANIQGIRGTRQTRGMHDAFVSVEILLTYTI